MNKRLAAVLTFLLAAAMLVSGCSQATKIDPKLYFITMQYSNDTTTDLGGGMQAISGTADGVFNLGMTRDQIVAAKGAMSIWSRCWFKYDENNICVSMMIAAVGNTTMYGTSLDSNYSDLIPAYTSKDKDIKVLLDTKTKVIFGKQIDGVNYTVTYRNYPNSGDVKTITITNSDKYTESDEDYPDYATN